MDREELMRLVAEDESETLERKENFDKSALQTAGAFANTKGGKIIVGVSNKGKVKGAIIGTETLKDWVNKVNQTTDPHITLAVKLGEMEDKKIVIIEISESHIKPIAVDDRCYIRVGASTRKMSHKKLPRCISTQRDQVEMGHQQYVIYL